MLVNYNFFCFLVLVDMIFFCIWVVDGVIYFFGMDIGNLVFGFFFFLIVGFDLGFMLFF